jgi:WD40 repeat protein
MKPTRTLLLAIPLCFLFAAVSHAADANWKVQKQMELHAEASALAYSSDGTRLAVAHSDGRVSVWNLKSGELVRVLSAHEKEANSVQFISNDSKLVTIGDDNKARMWSTSDWRNEATIDDVAFAGGVSADGRWLAAQDPEQAIWIWDLETLKPVRQLIEPGKGGARNITFTSDGKYIATSPSLINVDTKQAVSFASVGDKKTPLKIDQQGNQISVTLGALQDDDAPTHRVIPSRKGQLVALGRAWYGKPAFVDVWEIGAMKRLGRCKAKDLGTLTSFSFDNSLLAIEGSERVTIWKIETGKQITSVKGSGIMQFSPTTLELAVTDGTDLIIYAPKQ